MIRTHGLTHISLSVRDPERSLAFYRELFGVREYFRDENSIQVLGPGPHDVIVFERKPSRAGKSGGVVKERGEFVPGEPYEVEIWYEIPTKVDPKPA